MNKKTLIPELGNGTWLSLGSPVVAELASQGGFDWLLFDMEHGVLTEGGLMANLQAAKGQGTRLVVRVGSLDPLLIARVLDWGADGIMLPHVSRPSQAASCVQAMRYPPKGNRGYSSGARSYRYGLASDKEIASLPSPLFIAQIDDYDAVMNAEAIAMVDGVDVLFVGPEDLKLDLQGRNDSNSLAFQDALSRIVAVGVKTGVQTGILAKDTAQAMEVAEMGFNNVAVGSDLRFVREGLSNAIPKLMKRKRPSLE